jgi:hypothetical protein
MRELLDPDTGFTWFFDLDNTSQKIGLTLDQCRFIHLNLSVNYLLNRDDKFHLDFIESWVFSLDKPYDYKMCDVLIKCLVTHFLLQLISCFPNPHVYLESYDSFFYNDYRSNKSYFSN